MATVTLTREQARKLLDVIPETVDNITLVDFITALDEAQGDADEPGKDGELTVTIEGAYL